MKVDVETTTEKLSMLWPDSHCSQRNISCFELALTINTDGFKEIKQNRAYNLENLIGNVGGYVGLLLGYALLDFLSLLLSCYGKMKEMQAEKQH